VKDAYVDFKHMLTPTSDPRTRQVTTVGTGRPQSEIDKQVHITNRDYSADEYKRLNPAEKAKLWQLGNANRTPGTGPARRDHDSSVASTSMTATSASGKRQAEDAADKDEKPTDDASWGRNLDNPVLGRQVRSRNENNN